MSTTTTYLYLLISCVDLWFQTCTRNAAASILRHWHIFSRCIYFHGQPRSLTTASENNVGSWNARCYLKLRKKLTFHYECGCPSKHCPTDAMMRRNKRWLWWGYYSLPKGPDGSCTSMCNVSLVAISYAFGADSRTHGSNERNQPPEQAGCVLLLFYQCRHGEKLSIRHLGA